MGASFATLLAALGLVGPGCGEADTSADTRPAPAGERPIGPLVHEQIPGRWRKLRPERVDPGLSSEQRDLVARLEAIGYASGSAPAPERSGVTLHEPDRSFEGLNFYTSGHGPEAVLMDMEGRVLHRWHHAFRAAFPRYPEAWLTEGAEFWRRAHLFDNGDVLAIFEGFGLIKVDADSKLLWASPLRVHHDLEVTADGEIYVLTRRGHMIPRLDPDKPVLEDFVSVLDADGNEMRRVSILEALEASEFRDLWQADGDWVLGDIFHTNSLALLDGRHEAELPAFRRGNVLLSLLVPSLVAVLDMQAEKIVWARTGSFRRQHDAKLLDSGGLLLFDNHGTKPWSRVLELDPARPDALRWVYAGSEQTPLASPSCGTAERLPNGNTLITESDGGRAFEVTPEKETVWEFYNPHRAGDDRELVATLFELVRLPPDFPVDWAREPDVARGSTDDR